MSRCVAIVAIFFIMNKKMNSNTKRLSLVLISSIAFMFTACGDSGNTASPHSNADMEIRTYSELPSCAEKRDGKTAYVADQEQGYICQNGKWVEDDDVKVVDYPSSSTSLTGNLLTDTRDGQSYKTVTIGTQTWMAQNLNYETANSFCYGDKPSNCTKYGRLYTWAAAMDSVGTWSTNGRGCGYNKTCSPMYPVRGVCPEGWHLPTQTEWNTLFTAVGGQSTAGNMLKSTNGWNSSSNGTDAYSFSALPAGTRSDSGLYDLEGDYAGFWSSTESYNYSAYNVFLYYSYDDAGLGYYLKYNGFSVRCVKDWLGE